MSTAILNLRERCRSRITPFNKSTVSQYQKKGSVSNKTPVAPKGRHGGFRSYKLFENCVHQGQVSKLATLTKNFLPGLVCFCIMNSKNMTPALGRYYLRIVSTKPYFFASSAVMKKSRSVSFSTCASDLPDAFASILLSCSRVRRMWRAVISISVA